MNRRRVGIGLAAVAVVALFVAAKSAASWRPVEVAQMDRGIMAYEELDIQASSRYIVIGKTTGEGGPPDYKRINLQTGAIAPLRNAGFLANGAWTGYLVFDGKLRLQLRELDGPVSIYEVPLANIKSSFGKTKHLRPHIIRVTPKADRVEMIYKNRYYRWNQTSLALERDVALDRLRSPYEALSGDGETLINLEKNQIERNPTRSNKTPVVLSLKSIDTYMIQQISPYGSYAIYDDIDIKNSEEKVWFRIIDTRGESARELWNFAPRGYQIGAVFSPDETLVAIPSFKRNLWEIHDLESGALLATLPLLPKTETALFSPDGNTLYSVANGVLYRQRAR